MSAPVITVEGLGKRYTLHHQARAGLLRDQLASLLRNPFRRLKNAGNTAEEFWALRDVNFTVNQGDVLGIIGRNGAGKSTLLKILSRITEPTTGRITIQGRVASLLEVGTGFHGELSGRENIFLNGAILGMSRAEIRKKFDEIVAFAEVDKFLDTPVKHYSSGMYVRLAFAVAAHLEPEILIVDEVLAVGDQGFQKKCLGKMQEVATNQGRTVLFVSHNLSAIRELCQKCVLLRSGQIVQSGNTKDVADRYLALGQRSVYQNEGGSTLTSTHFKRIAILDSNDGSISSLAAGNKGTLELQAFVAEELLRVQVAVRVSSLEGVPVFTTANTDSQRTALNLTRGEHSWRFNLPDWLAPGFYSVTAAIHDPRRHSHAVVVDALQFEITPGANPATALQDDRRGIAEPILSWEHHHSSHVA